MAAVLASTCCVGPLVLALLGVSGAWISQLRWFAPYSTGLLVLAIALLGVAGWQLFRATPATGANCTAQDLQCRSAQAGARQGFWLVLALTLVPIVVPRIATLFY